MSDDPIASASRTGPRRTDLAVEHGDFRREIYSQCLQEKRHYDLMSWTIGGAITLISTLVVSQMFKLPEGTGAALVKLLIALAVAVLSGLWWAIYERNRFWGEVCNETAREIERQLGIEGLGHAYMRGAILHQITLRNVDVDGNPVCGPGGPVEARIESDKSRRSAHYAIRAVILMPTVIASGYALFGLVAARF
jgi:hypothetical protein